MAEASPSPTSPPDATVLRQLRNRQATSVCGYANADIYTDTFPRFPALSVLLILGPCSHAIFLL